MGLVVATLFLNNYPFVVHPVYRCLLNTHSRVFLIRIWKIALNAGDKNSRPSNIQNYCQPLNNKHCGSHCYKVNFSSRICCFSSCDDTTIGLCKLNLNARLSYAGCFTRERKSKFVKIIISIHQIFFQVNPKSKSFTNSSLIRYNISN